MIKFFRKIRLNLLAKNRYSKYLIYAIGEILLVVIGILIALQVNNWNQGRLNILEEEYILKNISAEFQINKDQFLNTHNRAKNALNASKTLSSLIGSNHKELSVTNIDSVIFMVFEYDNLVASENTILDLTQSGRLQIIRSDQLKNHLYQWTQQKNLIHENYFLARSKSALLVRYLSSRYSLKNIDMYGPFDWQEKSKLPNDQFLIFQELEFENILEDVIYAQYIYLKSLEKIENTIKSIISETN